MTPRATLQLILVLLLTLSGCGGSLESLSKSMDDLGKSLDPFASDEKDKDENANNAQPTESDLLDDANRMLDPFGGNAQDPPQNTAQAGQTQKTNVTENFEGNCCVNGAYYTCDSPGAVKQCVGQPMKLMSCVQSCGFDSNCEPACINQHGPDTSACQRQPARDGDCRR